MQTNPLNSIETTLGTLCGSQAFFVKTVAQKIRNGLVQEGFTVVKIDQVDRLSDLLDAIHTHTDENYRLDGLLQEALSIVEGWK